ncbi:MAG: hypothetical protein JXR70_01475 [Spirochaetales bacterium]|nr:hypothetical protein [Spirochaetales bacterium]
MNKLKFFIIFISLTLLFAFFTCQRLDLIEEKQYSDMNELSENQDNLFDIDETVIDKTLFTDIGEFYLLGGDILFDKSDPRSMLIVETLSAKTEADEEKIRNRFESRTSSKGFKLASTLTWQYGKIPYTLDSKFTSNEKNCIKTVMGDLEAACEVDFYEYKTGMLTFGNPVYKIIKKNDGSNFSSSTLGASGRAECRLTGVYYDHVLHEFCHGLGMKHEHQRYDRDDYITIMWDNIDPDFKDQFAKIPRTRTSWIILPIFEKTVRNSYTYGSYDYLSVMHYRNTAFSKNGMVTIDAHGHRVRNTSLSQLDKKTLQTLYPDGKFGPYDNNEYYPKSSNPYNNPYGSSASGTSLLEKDLSNSFAVMDF